MGSTSGGKKKYTTFRSRQRANMSFFIVVMFFAVFGIIVFTEIFLIDERGRGAGVVVRHGSLSYNHKHQERADYEDPLQSDDYISIRVGPAPGLEDVVGAFLIGQPIAAIPVMDDDGPESSKVITEAQLPPYPSNATPSDGKWQNVNGTRYKFYVFSAFFDSRRGQRSVRVIGATKTRAPERVWCRLWYRASDKNNTNVLSRTVVAKIKVIRENWNLKYSACFVMCALQSNQTIPFAVSVVSKVRLPSSNLLTVINNSNHTKPHSKFAVCVKPLHFDYNRALQILEFIELNRIMGVQHFTFYNHTIGPQVRCILDEYVSRGLVTLLPWQLNILSQKEIRTEGLFAALNDCLYRSMYHYSHVILIDLDEFIIPKHNDTLPHLIEYLNVRMNTRTTGSYSFQNAFFYLQWGDDDWVYGSSDSVATGLVTLKKTRRRTKLHPHKQRSKYICKPELVVEAGNHFVWEFIPGHGTLNVPADAAILHHYRICEFGGDDCIKTASTVDTTAFRYKKKLIGNVKQQYKHFKSKCRLPEPPPPPVKMFKLVKAIEGRGEKDNTKEMKLR